LNNLFVGRQLDYCCSFFHAHPVINADDSIWRANSHYTLTVNTFDVRTIHIHRGQSDLSAGHSFGFLNGLHD